MFNKTKVIIALGGNALQSKDSEPTAEAQLSVVKKTCQYIAKIIYEGYQVAIVHGNGPQVGRIIQAQEAAKDIVPPLPFDVCGAMSQGYIGYHLQQSLKQAINQYRINMPVVTLVTQVIVDDKDPAFKNPSKPIGSFYSQQEAKQLSNDKNYNMKEDAGRGWRRVVASPKPKKIVEIKTIKGIWGDTVVIACGGGGIPVVEQIDGSLGGIDAVIDKDFAAALLAENLHADMLLILTEVEKVAIHFNTPDQIDITHMSSSEAEGYIKEGHFAAGSMLPKVQAAINFVRSHPDKKAIISSLDKAYDALNGKTGTQITFEK